MDRFASVLGAKVGGKADLVHLGLSCGRVYSESMWPSKLAVLKMLGMVADTVQYLPEWASIKITKITSRINDE
jgi:hypothetical protein